jgi:hypothetical protein
VAKLKAALLLLAVAATAHADWTIAAATTEGSRDEVQHRHVVLKDAETSESATVDLALFSTKSCTLRVIDQPTPPRNGLAHVMAQENCLAGVNGGYFDSDYAPIGLLIVDGKTIAPLQRARLLTGVLTASARGVQSCVSVNSRDDKNLAPQFSADRSLSISVGRSAVWRRRAQRGELSLRSQNRIARPSQFAPRLRWRI